MKIIHISDLHIRESNTDECYYAFEQFLKSVIDIKNNLQDDEKLVIVISGDIFHSRTRLTPNEFRMGSIILETLDDICPTIIIPGYHDVNPRGEYDLISPLLEELERRGAYKKNLHYFPYGGVKIIDGITFTMKGLLHKGSGEDGGSGCSGGEDGGENGGENILVAYEILAGAAMKNNESASVIKYRGVSQYEDKYMCGMFGGVHKHQYMNDNFVYAGSFIQHDEDEDPLEHGYVLWDINDMVVKNITHVPVYNKFGSIVKLKIFNNIVEFQKLGLIKKIKYFVIHQSNCSKEYINNVITTVIKKHPDSYCKKIVDLTYYNLSEDKKQIKFVHRELLDIETHKTLLRKWITDKYPAEDIDRCMKIYETEVSGGRCGAGLNDGKYVGFRIDYLEWMNLSCYSNDIMHHINFSGVYGDPISIKGKNKSGKSSIIDILVYILFNKSFKNKTSTLLNLYSDKYHVKVVVSVAGTKYSLCRTGDKTRFSRYMTINKLVGSRSDEECSGALVSKKYEWLCYNITGSYHNFLNINLMYQNSELFSNIGGTNQKEYIYKLLNMSSIIDSKKKLESKSKRLMSKLSTMQRELIRTVCKDDELDSLMLELEQIKIHNSEVLEKINLLDDEIANTNNLIDDEVKRMGLMINNVDIYKNRMVCNGAYDDIKYKLVDCDKIVACRDRLADLIKYDDEIINKKYPHPDKLKQYEGKKPMLKKLIYVLPTDSKAGEIKIIDNMISEYTKYAKYKKVKKPADDKYLEHPIDMLESYMAVWDNEMDSVVADKPSPIDGVGNIGNTKSIDNLIRANMVNIEKIINNGNDDNNSILAIVKNVKGILDKRNEIVKYWDDMEKWNKYMDHMLMVDTLSYLGYCEYERLLDEKKILDRHESQVNKRIKLEEDNILIEELAKYNKLMADKLEKRKKLDECNLKINNHDKHMLYVEASSMVDKYDTYSKYSKTLERLGNKKKNLNLELRMDDIKMYDAMIVKTKVDNEKHSELVSEIDKLKGEINIYKILIHALGIDSDGFTIKLFNITADHITAVCNRWLQIISNFTISVPHACRSWDILVSDGIPLSNGSGFQKFIISILIRYAFLTIHSKYNRYYDGIIIDEGFGSCDDEHIDLIVRKCLPFLADQVSLLMLITHKEHVMSNTKHSIDIAEHIQYGEKLHVKERIIIIPNFNTIEGKVYFRCLVCNREYIQNATSISRHIKSKGHQSKI